MMKKRIITALLILTMLFTMVPATGLPVEAAKKKVVKVKKVTLNKKSITLQVGNSMRLKATLSPKKTTQKTLIWSTSNKKIAKVSQKGTVKAVKKGTATITVKVKGTNKKAKCKITVKYVPKCSSKYKGKDKIKHNKKQIASKAATCSSTGYKKYKCTRCGYTWEETIKKNTSHTWKTIRTIKTSTCTSTGSVQKTCTRCGETKKESTEKIPHSYSLTSEKKSTCQSEGYILKSCINCGQTKDKEVIAKLPHKSKPIEESETYTISRCSNCNERTIEYHDKEYTIEFKDGTTKTVVGHYEPFMEEEMFKLLNEYRVKNGLHALELGDDDLREKARIRAREIAVHPYHNRPGGGKWGYRGENLACRPQNCEQAMNGFIDSEIHNNRMLNEFYEINYSAVFAAKDSITNLYFYYYIQSFNYDE